MGSPPPEPPDAVPALTPDTSKAVTPREMLAAHMAEESCSACHKKIDPWGIAFEHFDGIGRRNDFYSLFGRLDQFPVADFAHVITPVHPAFPA